MKLLRKGLSKPNISLEKMMKKLDGSKCVNAEENAEVFREHSYKLHERETNYDNTVMNLQESKAKVLTIPRLIQK